MALFKINRGDSSNLPSAMNDGWAYFCTDTAEFYIDYKDSAGTLHRKAINAKEAEALTGYDIAAILNSSDLEIPTSKAVLDALGGKVDKQSGKGLSTNDYTTAEKNKLANALPKTGGTLGTVMLTSGSTYGTALPSSMSANQLFFLKMNIYEYLYPVGAIYLTGVNTNPASLFGIGTWTSLSSPISGKYAFQRTA